MLLEMEMMVPYIDMEKTREVEPQAGSGDRCYGFCFGLKCDMFIR